MVEPNSPPPKVKPDSGKNKISIADATKKQQGSKSVMQLEEFQNKENENPQKKITTSLSQEPIRYTPEEDALYAQVHARLEPEGASRDTEDESDRGLSGPRHNLPENGDREEKLYAYAKCGAPPDRNGYLNPLPKPLSSDHIDLLVRNQDKPEDIYAAINKSGHPKKFKFPVPEEVWDVPDVKRTAQQVSYLSTTRGSLKFNFFFLTKLYINSG